MLLSELTTLYRPIWPEDGNWESTKNHLLSDPAEARIVKTLMAELQTNNKFNEPVCIGLGDFPNPESSNPDDYIEIPCVLNGTHRVVAAIINNAKEIDTITEEERKTEWKTSPNPTHYLETTVTFTQPLSDELNDSLFSTLRSFRLDDQTWLEADIMTGSAHLDNSYIKMLWNITPTTESFNKTITKKVKEQLNTTGYEHLYNSVITVIEEYEPDEIDETEHSDNL